jgi:hypothetical protein
MTLILKHANKSRPSAIDGGTQMKLMFLSPQATQGRPWLWTITARDYPRSIHNRGYSATREQAMADFKTRCLAALPYLRAYNI